MEDDRSRLSGGPDFELTSQVATGPVLDEFLTGVSDEHRGVIPYAEGDNYLTTMNVHSRDDIRERTYLTRLAHFLPGKLVQRYDLTEEYRGRCFRVISSALAGELEEQTPAARQLYAEVARLPISDDKLSRIIESLPEGAVASPASTLDDIVRAYRASSRGKRNRGALQFGVNDLARLLAFGIPIEARVSGVGLRIYSRAWGTVVELATQQVTEFFTRSLRYLGPSRANNQQHGFAPSGEADDVGSGGEFAAAVYETNKDARVAWWDPDAARQRVSRVSEAVDTWVRYIGIADSISTSEAEMSGVSWVIRHRPGSREQPLGAVGVGVSQLLPVLVGGLLAPPGTLLLYEEPELHLHARAQAWLGDFFVGLARMGKQCSLETHSEALVNQFRYHIVRQEFKEDWPLRIYFAHQDDLGDTSFLPISVSRSGNVLNAPQGFFDEPLIQEESIARESVLARGRK